MKVRLLLSLAIIAGTFAADNPWTYRDQGIWSGDCSIGKRQSPINIITNKAKQLDLGRFRFTNYIVKPDVQTISNDGHSVKVSFNRPVTFISRGGLPAYYMFLQYHFHWGPDDYSGSEHQINGRKYPLELHLVHWNTRYGSVENALVEPDGLAVLGILYELGDYDNQALEPIIQNFPSVSESGSEAEVTNLPPLSELLPSDRSRFYRYSGSLTTPGCNEAVVWTVFEDTLKVSARQLEAFRNLKDSSGNYLEYNFRDDQPMNSRLVLRSGPILTPGFYFKTLRLKQKSDKRRNLNFLYKFLCGADKRYCLPSAPY